MSLRYALLGLLADAPASGYDLTKKFERLLRRYAWHAQHSQIYPELNKLAADGLIAVAEEGARGRRTYAITDAGRDDLRQWMVNPPDVFVVRNEFVLRLFLLSTLDADEAKALLRRVADANGQELQRLSAQVKDFDAAAEPGTPPLFQRLVAEFGVRSFQTLQDWALWAMDRIDQADVSNDTQTSPVAPKTRPQR